MTARTKYTGAFLDNCHRQELRDYPKARATLMGWDDEQLHRERREMLRASSDRMFGHNAAKMLALIEQEIAAR